MTELFWQGFLVFTWHFPGAYMWHIYGQSSVIAQPGNWKEKITADYGDGIPTFSAPTMETGLHAVYLYMVKAIVTSAVNALENARQIEKEDWHQGWGQFRFLNSNSNCNSGPIEKFNSNSGPH